MRVLWVPEANIRALDLAAWYMRRVGGDDFVDFA